jgi:hypothetical protein
LVFITAGLIILGCSKTRDLLLLPNRTSELTRISNTRTIPNPAGGLAGEWQVFFSWGCGSYSETTWILHPDGTFYAPDINRGGKWSMEGREVVLTFPYSPFVVFTGILDPEGQSIKGTMGGNDGSSGCWNAAKKSSAS